MVTRVSYLDFGEFLIEQDFKSPFRIVGAGEFILYEDPKLGQLISGFTVSCSLSGYGNYPAPSIKTNYAFSIYLGKVPINTAKHDLERFLSQIWMQIFG